MKNVPPSVRAALKRRGADQILEQEGEYQQFKPQIDQILHSDNSKDIVKADYDEEYDNDLSPAEQKATDRIEELGDKYKSGNDKPQQNERDMAIDKIKAITDRINATDADDINGYLTNEESAMIKDLAQKHKITADELKQIGGRALDKDMGGYDVNEYGYIEKQRFSKEPNIKDYDINDELRNNLRDYEYYSRIDDVNKALENEKSWKTKIQNERFRTQDDFDKIDRRISLLSEPRIQKYVNDRNAFNKQFEKDYEEYAPTARQAIINKLLGENDLYFTEKFNDAKDDMIYSSDLYDQVNNDFAKKYGYERTNYGDMFYRTPFETYLEENKEKSPDGSYYSRRKYNKERMLSDMLKNGDITLADLRKLLGGK